MYVYLREHEAQDDTLTKEFKMSKEQIVVDMVKAGESTREEIKEEAECTSGSLASYLSGMRNAAKYTGVAICPVEIVDPNDEDRKIFTVMTFDEVEEIKAERVAKPAASKKTPAERLEAAEKREARCDKAVEAADKRADADPDNEELSLRAQKADIEFKLAGIELERAQMLVDDAPELDEEAELV